MVTPHDGTRALLTARPCRVYGGQAFCDFSHLGARECPETELDA